MQQHEFRQLRVAGFTIGDVEAIDIDLAVADLCEE